jgi:hypothetical protein
MPAYVSMLLFVDLTEVLKTKNEFVGKLYLNPTINPVFITAPFAVAPHLPMQSYKYLTLRF